MGMRNQWQFLYQCSELVDACRERLGHHQQRLRFWRAEHAKADADLREHGLEFREHAVTGGNRVQAVLDPERSQRVDECLAKVRDHERAIESFSAYLVGFEHSPADATIGLEADDIVFFGLVPDIKAS